MGLVGIQKRWRYRESEIKTKNAGNIQHRTTSAEREEFSYGEGFH